MPTQIKLEYPCKLPPGSVGAGFTREEIWNWEVVQVGWGGCAGGFGRLCKWVVEVGVGGFGRWDRKLWRCGRWGVE